MARKNLSLPVEEPLPPMEKPVVVRDDKYTDVPTTDRAILAKCIEELTRKLKQALENDVILYRRFARRIVLTNRIRHKRDGQREHYEVPLPIAASCWNDVNIYDLEYRMISAIMGQDNKHVWYHIRVHFDDFIDQETRDYIDKIDRGESLSPEPQSQTPRPGPSREKQANSRLSQSVSPKPSTSSGTSSSSYSSKKVPDTVVTIETEDSDDEEVLILN